MGFFRRHSEEDQPYKRTTEQPPQGFNVPDHLRRERIELGPDQVNAEVELLRQTNRLSEEIIHGNGIDMQMATLASPGHPERNEDSALMSNDEERGFFCCAVLDGVSGQRGGQKASTIFREEILNELKRVNNGRPGPREILQAIRRGAEHATRILDADDPDGDADTTLSLVFGFRHPDGSCDLFTVNVGDSRVYLFQDDRLHQLTRDDSLVQNLAESYVDEIGREHPAAINELEAKLHPRRNEIAYSARHPRESIAGGQAEPGHGPYTVGRYTVKSEAEILIVSDGISDQVREDRSWNELEGMVRQGINPVGLTAVAELRHKQQLDRLSKKSGDDATAISIRLKPIKSQAQPDRSEPGRRREEQNDPERTRRTQPPRERPEQIPPLFVNIFNKLTPYANRQMRSFIAHETRGDFSKRDELTPRDVQQFLQRYPTWESYQNEGNTFVDSLEAASGTAEDNRRKQAEYRQALFGLRAILWPSRRV